MNGFYLGNPTNYIYFNVRRDFVILSSTWISYLLLLYFRLCPTQVGSATCIIFFRSSLSPTMSPSTPHTLVFFLIIFIHFFIDPSFFRLPSALVSPMSSLFILPKISNLSKSLCSHFPSYVCHS